MYLNHSSETPTASRLLRRLARATTINFHPDDFGDREVALSSFTAECHVIFVKTLLPDPERIAERVSVIMTTNQVDFMMFIASDEENFSVIKLRRSRPVLHKSSTEESLQG